MNRCCSHWAAFQSTANRNEGVKGKNELERERYGMNTERNGSPLNFNGTILLVTTNAKGSFGNFRIGPENATPLFISLACRTQTAMKLHVSPLPESYGLYHEVSITWQQCNLC
jgi:hypothetical protein